MACDDYMYISRVICLLIYVVAKSMMYKHVEPILQRYLYFISTVYNTLSIAQHIIGGPVRHIVGITFAVVHASCTEPNLFTPFLCDHLVLSPY